VKKKDKESMRDKV